MLVVVVLTLTTIWLRRIAPRRIKAWNHNERLLVLQKMCCFSCLKQWQSHDNTILIRSFKWNNSYVYCGYRCKWRVIIAVNFPTSFPGSLFSASLGRWKKDPGCGWSHDHPESGWQKNLLGGRGSRVLCLVDVKNFVGFKSSSSR